MRIHGAVLIVALIMGTQLAALPAGGAVLRVVEQNIEIDGNSPLQVVVMVEDAALIAGLEFSLVYPGDVLAVVDPTSHQPGDFLATPVVNHDGDPAGLPAGMRRINVALAAAEASGVATGTVVTIEFPLRCSDFSGDWPDGRVLAIGLVDVVAWGIGAGGLPETIAITPLNGSFLINCTKVPVESMGLSTLKARFSSTREER